MTSITKSNNLTKYQYPQCAYVLYFLINVFSVLFHLVEMPVDKHTNFLNNKMQAGSFVIH